MKTYAFAAFFALAAALCPEIRAEETDREEDPEEEIVENRTVVAYDTYDLALSLKVPQVFDNTQSLGKRRFAR